MSNIEYLKLIHHNYTRFYILTLFMFCISMVFCSYAYGENLNCGSSSSYAFAQYKTSSSFYSKANAHIEHCIPRLGNLFITNDDLTERFQRTMVGTLRSPVHVYTSFMRPGSYKNDDSKNPLDRARDFSIVVLEFCSNPPIINSPVAAPTDAQTKFSSELCPYIKILSSMTVVKVGTSITDTERANLETIGITFTADEDELAKLFVSCSTDGNTEACEQACTQVENGASIVRKDFVCRMNLKTRLCFQRGSRELCEAACRPKNDNGELKQDGQHHRDHFSCQIADGNMKFEGEGTDRRLVTIITGLCPEEGHVRNATGQCGPPENEACSSGEHRNAAGTCVACENEICGSRDPVNPLDPNNDPANDPTNPIDDPTNEDLNNLENLANNIGNDMFGSGSNGGFGGGGSGGGGSTQMPKINVKGNSKFSGLLHLRPLGYE